MKRLPWKRRGSHIDLSLAGFPESFVLVPESNDDKTELENALDAQSVCDRMSFNNKNGINGRLDFPTDLNWDSDGAVELTITTDQNQQIPAWFWLVENDDRTGLRFAWWGTQQDRDLSNPWA